jgi:hypothetical protein
MIERIKDLEYKLVTRESRPEDRERIAQVFSPIPVPRVRELGRLRSCEPIWRHRHYLCSSAAFLSLSMSVSRSPSLH